VVLHPNTHGSLGVNNHFRNSVWPILDLYAIQLRLVIKRFCRCFFNTFVKFLRYVTYFWFNTKVLFSCQYKDCFIDFTYPKC
jgi:hypothetical protein